ncbi:MAG: hypothetical protein M1822_005622 [Bathelium mastoideum]|nr:MAG: hypothetical protein M1822_005622 [Bathelium mastoideum]
MATVPYDLKALFTFFRTYSAKYIYVQWIDYMGTLRSRVYPVPEFSRIILSGSCMGVARGNIGMLQNDHMTGAVDTTGQINIEPDIRSLRPAPAKDPMAPAATIMAFWRDEACSPAPEDPRRGLEVLLHRLRDEFNTHILLGFEAEVTFLRRTTTELPYAPLTTNHAWGTLTTDQCENALPLIADIVETLSSIGINIQHFHAEGGQGQYEIALPPLEPIEAIDTLIQARRVIARVAANAGIRATFHPRPLPGGVSTAAQANVSLNSVVAPPAVRGRTAIPTEIEVGFWAGVKSHLEAICAFTLPESDSYERVIDNNWSMGTWLCWGTQNRETPLRRVGGDGRWEVRCLDGFANMYLALAAVVAAGRIGLQNGLGEDSLGRDCPYNPALMTEEQRLEYGIVRRLPRTIDEALSALENDRTLAGGLGADITRNYIVMKQEEQRMLNAMSEGERRIWLIERY